MLILRGEWDVNMLRVAGEEAVELVSACLEMDRRKRWTIMEVLECRFLDGQKEIYAQEFGN